MKKIVFIFLLNVNLIFANNIQEPKEIEKKSIFLKEEFHLKDNFEYLLIDKEGEENNSLFSNNLNFSFFSFFNFLPLLSINIENSIYSDFTNNETKSNLDEFYLNYTLFDNTFFRIGKQSLNINNERFISSNDFQNSYVSNFNAFSIANNKFDNLVFLFSYLYKSYNYNNVIEDDKIQGSYIFNIKYIEHKIFKNINFYYFDFKDKHTTYGIQFKNNNNDNIKYIIEIANQYSNTKNNSKSNYYNLMIGYKYNDVITNKIAIEYFGKNNLNNDNLGFTIPYGNINNFNGKLSLIQDYIINGHKNNLIDYKILNNYNDIDYGNFNLDFHSFFINNDNLGNEIDFYYSQNLNYIYNSNISIGYYLYFNNDDDFLENKNSFQINFNFKI
jgi:hypothetical protein